MACIYWYGVLVELFFTIVRNGKYVGDRMRDLLTAYGYGPAGTLYALVRTTYRYRTPYKQPASQPAIN